MKEYSFLPSKTQKGRFAFHRKPALFFTLRIWVFLHLSQLMRL